MDYIKTLKRIAQANISKAEDAGCGMYNFHINLGSKFRDDEYDAESTLFQIYPYDAVSYGGGVWVLWYYKDKFTEEYENYSVSINEMTEEEKSWLLAEVRKQIGEEDITYEICPHCGKEVVLDAELKVQVCPECGRHIVACSMCLAHADNQHDCCVNCCLCYHADIMNEKSFLMDDTHGHNPSLVELINKAWKECPHDAFKPIIKALIYRDNDECVEKMIIKEVEDMWVEDWDWESRVYEYLTEVADDTDLVTILNFLHRDEITYSIEK